MGNNTSHYFGAYLEISVNEVSVTRRVSQCESGHRVLGQFCNICGCKIGMADVTVMEYPLHIIDFLPMAYEDVLGVITPPSLFSTGMIIAVGNAVDVVKEPEKWLSLSSYGNEVETKEFPDSQDIAKMKLYLSEHYAGIIAALKASPVVRDVQIKAGYVFDVEY